MLAWSWSRQFVVPPPQSAGHGCVVARARSRCAGRCGAGRRRRHPQASEVSALPPHGRSHGQRLGYHGRYGGAGHGSLQEAQGSRGPAQPGGCGGGRGWRPRAFESGLTYTSGCCFSLVHCCPSTVLNLHLCSDNISVLLHLSSMPNGGHRPSLKAVLDAGALGFGIRLVRVTDGVSLWDHDWQRAARMASYGFLIYGPLSQVWYEILDHFMPVKNLTNLSLKVVANQVILGPIVITLVFAWNKLWEGRLEQLPDLYRTRALQTLFDGWKFWIPASILNFGVIPLQTRVAFMSSCSIFWNFYLSNTMQGKGKALPASKSE